MEQDLAMMIWRYLDGDHREYRIVLPQGDVSFWDDEDASNVTFHEFVDPGPERVEKYRQSLADSDYWEQIWP